MNEIIFRYINSIAEQYHWLDLAIIFFADYFIFILALSALFLALYHKSEKQVIRNLAFIFISGIVAWVLVQFIKHYYFSPRPFLALDEVRQLIEHGANDSFPSGHAAFSFAIATAVYFWKRKYAWIFFIGALFVGLARVAGGIHWPYDILGGIALGVVVTSLIHFLLKSKRFSKNLKSARPF
ncbi:MAG: phosphatase PAP2 family protein [Parcubacteria group bacterium]|nr:phosphatase PAP2 family protein [Parcubacteria group bacterium]MCR4343053.1 phosphatase PAP2 family protein [Patescibacteria group bacterium]